MLRRIEINGFKSFAKKSVITFQSTVVGIVGPNGSGKSNVAESFRFVLGEQSMKTMRSGKGEDLLWNGSIAVPKANKASVLMTFDNSDGTFALDVPEISIERAVYRDGQNEYFLNGKQVRLKDITELLASISIGTSKHHIISQGQADRMLNASPQERRDMLLDSLGLTAIDIKKTEAEKNLEKTNTHLREVEIARKEARPRLLFLEKQMEKFARAEKMRAELLEQASLFIATERTRITTEQSRILSESREPRERLKEYTARREQLRANAARAHDLHAHTVLKEETQHAYEHVRMCEQQLSECIRERARVAARLEVLSELPHDTARSDGTISLSEDHIAALRTADERIGNAVRVSGDYHSAFQELKHAIRDFLLRLPRTQKKESTAESTTEEQKRALASEETALSEKEGRCTQELTAAKNTLREYELRAGNARIESAEEEREILSLSASIAELTSRVHDLDRAVQDLRAHAQNIDTLHADCAALLGVAFAKAHSTTPSHIATTPKALHDIERLKIRVEEFGSLDPETEKEYKNAKERDEFLAKELADVTTAHDTLVALIDTLTREMNDTFTAGLHEINTSFETFFQSLFGGGEARLVETSDSRTRRKGEETQADEAPRHGIDIHVHLPKKKVGSLGMLSGGERALTSIALICALSQVHPPPFIVLDETDAALDEANSARFAQMVRTLSERSQCIVITHNRATMAAAGELYGITMGNDGVSKLLSVRLEEAERVAK